MSVLTYLSESLGEVEFMQEPHTSYGSDDMILFSCSNFGEEHLHYFIVYQQSTDKLCRLDMLSPNYIGYKDEELKLSKEEIDKLIDILNFKGTQMNNCVENMSIWDSIIFRTNERYTMTSYDYFYVPMPIRMEMPDYTKLPGADGRGKRQIKNFPE